MNASWLSADDIAVKFGISIHTARNWLRQMECIRVGRVKRVCESVLDQFIESHTEVGRAWGTRTVKETSKTSSSVICCGKTDVNNKSNHKPYHGSAKKPRVQLCDDPYLNPDGTLRRR